MLWGVAAGSGSHSYKVNIRLVRLQHALLNSDAMEEELENWSYVRMSLASHDAKGKIILKADKKRKTKCPLGRKIVSSPFFRSIVYHIDHLIDSAREICEFRRRDLQEFDHYVNDEQTDPDPDYRHELAREIIYWERMIDLYVTIRKNKKRWFKEGKFPWSGVKIVTPYFDAPPVRMTQSENDHKEVDREFTPVQAVSNFVTQEFCPITKPRKKKSKKNA